MSEGTAGTYSSTSRWLHWSMAILILCLIAAGLIMVELPGGALKNNTYELHKSFGITVFVLAVLRVLWRASQGFPALPASVPGWQQGLARATHLALYVLIVLVPVLGFVGTSMCCSPVNLFWTVPVPIELPGGMETAKTVLWLHKIAVFTMAGILALHVAGALQHAIIKKDGVFQRMWGGSAR